MCVCLSGLGNWGEGRGGEWTFEASPPDLDRLYCRNSSFQFDGRLFFVIHSQQNVALPLPKPQFELLKLLLIGQSKI